MPKAIALIVTDLQRSRLGLASRVAQHVGQMTVLEQTISRVAQVASVRSILLVHPEGQDPLALLSGRKFNKPLRAWAPPSPTSDPYLAMRTASRKWALTAWRGGLAGSSCYDELLPATPLAAALDHDMADSALLLGADWMLVDPDYCQQVLALHLANPQAMAMTFTQAPPGLGGLAISRQLLSNLAKQNGLIGHMLSYNPTAPQPDPIGRDVCVQIEPQVRNCNHRFIYDTDRSTAMIDRLAQQLGDRFSGASARTVAESVAGNEHARCSAYLPRQVTLELTPQRLVTGPFIVQTHVDMQRQPMPLDVASKIVSQLGSDGDTVLMLGGLGDALLYAQWEKVVRAAHEAGVLGIAIETDLLVDQPALEALVNLPVDVVSVRLNADTAHTYEVVMGANRFGEVVQKLQWLLSNRQEGDRPGLPWIVPRLVKTHQTLDDMESFFDRWVHFTGSAVIEPATTGCQLMPALSPVDMAPPKRCPCRQLDKRMTIHSDGRVALCDQDWLGRASPGNAVTTPLKQIWQSMDPLRLAHQEKRWDQLELCKVCREWHRP